MGKLSVVAAALVLATVGCKEPVVKAPRDASELELPKEVLEVPDAAEFMRVWDTGGTQTVIIAPKRAYGAREWGILLSDIAQHAANSREMNFGEDRKKFLAELKKSF